MSEKDADGDTIIGFQPGDKIDLQRHGRQQWCLRKSGLHAGAPASTLSGAAQLIVTHETRDDGDYTVGPGEASTATAAPNFASASKGNHNLTTTDFNL